MSPRPRLRVGPTLAPGLLAVVLFGIMAAIALNTDFGEMTGYPEGISITAEIGYAMFDLGALQSGEGALGATEPFLIAFLLIAVLLDAALDASLVLAKREEGGEAVSPLASQTTSQSGGESGTPATDGGRQHSSQSSEPTDESGGEHR